MNQKNIEYFNLQDSFGQSLKEDHNGIVLRNTLDTLAQYEGKIKSENNQGLPEDTFKKNQLMLTTLVTAANFVRAYHKAAHTKSKSST